MDYEIARTADKAISTESTTMMTVQQTRLSESITQAERFINKQYLADLHRNEVVPIEQLADNLNQYGIRLYRIEELVYDRAEDVNNKLISVYSALQNIGSSAFMFLDSNGATISIYIGIYSQDDPKTASEILKRSFEGNFAGSRLSKQYSTRYFHELFERTTDCDDEDGIRFVSSVTMIPSTRDDKDDSFVQGMEKLIDTMQGEKYSMIVIARNVGNEEKQEIRRGFEDTYTLLAPFQKTTLAYGESSSESESEGVFSNYSSSMNENISRTIGWNTGTSHSRSNGTNKGRNLSILGMGHNWGSSIVATEGLNYGKNESEAESKGTTTSSGGGKNENKTKTIGDTKTLTVENHNKYAIDLIGKIEENLERLKQCEAFGLWECAAYFIADNIQTSVVGANAFRALMAGNNTAAQNAFVNVWTTEIDSVVDYLKYAQHPVVRLENSVSWSVTPGTYISSKELAIMMGLPRKSVSGLTVNTTAEFGRNIYTSGKQNARPSINVGKVLHLRKQERTEVRLDLKSLSSHCFITGSTGCGKSNTTYCIIEELLENKIPFLVIEPAKGEYKDEFGKIDNINIFSTNPYIAQMLRVNPFAFDSRIHVLEHLDRLIDVFNTCWEMYSAMPAILKKSIERTYRDKGWDLLNSIYLKDGDPEFPTFEDLIGALKKEIANSGYSAEVKGNYTGALVTRVESLANGIAGQIFCDGYSIPDTELFDQNTIIDLSRVGSSETKSLIMGMLVIKLSEHRMATADSSNKDLQHITIMEEAHNLLKRVYKSEGGSNVIGKSVEMISTSIAEMRTYGEGFIIVDQSPTAVDESAVKNTNTKIVMRLPDQTDCIEMGNALSLNDEQIKEIARLGTGSAVVMQNDWIEAVLAQINLAQKTNASKVETCKFEDILISRSVLLEELINQYSNKHLNHAELLNVIDGLTIDKHKKEEFGRFIYEMFRKLKYTNSDRRQIVSQTVLRLSGCKELFAILSSELRVEQDSDNKKHYTADSIERWHDRLKNSLSRYVELPMHLMPIFEYLLIFAMRSVPQTINYSELLARVDLTGDLL